ncbi:MAG: Phospho-N-acetylmuramoyl-pentapeptide-transferase [candidate division TM6 bacterium GW2011_GWE2_42_60]|nr:MAG: Phospho-N-acetylmuramoyl-pentapeptide-transferase [candidate division TM6 bacterium GW2011_GWE2_42_60]HBY05665.1 phospho-N-acetylmuramoyl-pentapeptide-transferase [Candidatus Dependentiae bacterium]
MYCVVESASVLRLIFAAIGAFFVSWASCAFFIKRFNRWTRSAVREYVTELHKAKDQTPTMGGVPMIFAAILALLFLMPFKGPQTLLVMGALVFFGLIGGWDDWKKITCKKGISDRSKFIAQIVAAATSVALWFWMVQPATTLWLPGNWHIELGAGLFFLWAVWVILCTDNAVNFTDGLDGLAGSLLLINFVTFAVIALFLGQNELAEISVICASVLGGFLWFNLYPATVFMGDVGALGFGAALALVALMLHRELLIPLTGGLFVLEGVSVVVQKMGYRLRKIRVFKMAPIHHHFELSGMSETKITARFVLTTLILCLLALYLFLK